MPRKLPPDSTIQTVWPHLVHQKDYVSGVLRKMRQCNSTENNSWVVIGVTGKGQKPYYRISFKTSAGDDKIFGSFYDNHEPLENGFAITCNWSTSTTSFEELLDFYADAIGHKGRRA